MRTCLAAANLPPDGAAGEGPRLIAVAPNPVRTSPLSSCHQRSREEQRRDSPQPEKPGGARPHLATVNNTTRGAGGEPLRLTTIAPPPEETAGNHLAWSPLPRRQRSRWRVDALHHCRPISGGAGKRATLLHQPLVESRGARHSITFVALSSEKPRGTKPRLATTGEAERSAAAPRHCQQHDQRSRERAATLHCRRPANGGDSREPPSLLAVTPRSGQSVTTARPRCPAAGGTRRSTALPRHCRPAAGGAGGERPRITAVILLKKTKWESGHASPPLLRRPRSREERGSAPPRPPRRWRGRGRVTAPHHCAPSPKGPGGAPSCLPGRALPRPPLAVALAARYLGNLSCTLS